VEFNLTKEKMKNERRENKIKIKISKLLTLKEISMPNRS